MDSIPLPFDTHVSPLITNHYSASVTAETCRTRCSSPSSAPVSSSIPASECTVDTPRSKGSEYITLDTSSKPVSTEASAPSVSNGSFRLWNLFISIKEKSSEFLEAAAKELIDSDCSPLSAVSPKSSLSSCSTYSRASTSTSQVASSSQVSSCSSPSSATCSTPESSFSVGFDGMLSAFQYFLGDTNAPSPPGNPSLRSTTSSHHPQQKTCQQKPTTPKDLVNKSHSQLTKRINKSHRAQSLPNSVDMWLLSGAETAPTNAKHTSAISTTPKGSIILDDVTHTNKKNDLKPTILLHNSGVANTDSSDSRSTDAATEPSAPLCPLCLLQHPLTEACSSDYDNSTISQSTVNGAGTKQLQNIRSTQVDEEIVPECVANYGTRYMPISQPDTISPINIDQEASFVVDPTRFNRMPSQPLLQETTMCHQWFNEEGDAITSIHHDDSEPKVAVTPAFQDLIASLQANPAANSIWENSNLSSISTYENDDADWIDVQTIFSQCKPNSI